MEGASVVNPSDVNVVDDQRNTEENRTRDNVNNDVIGRSITDQISRKADISKAEHASNDNSTDGNNDRKDDKVFEKVTSEHNTRSETDGQQKNKVMKQPQNIQGQKAKAKFSQEVGVENDISDEKATTSNLNTSKDEEGDQIQNNDSKKDVTSAKATGITTEVKDTARQNSGEQTTDGSSHSSQEPGEKLKEKHEMLKEKLLYHFSDPYTRVCREQKWYKRCPEKLVILGIKFFFVTAQLCMFGADRADFANYLIRSNIALKHLLLKGWDTSFETMPYPPSTGTFAVYRIEELLEHIDFTVKAVNDIPTTALGSFFVIDDTSPNNTIKMCLEYFKKGIYNRNGEVEIDSTVTSECQWINVDWKSKFDPSLEDLIRSTNGNLVRLLHVTLSFSIDSIYVHLEKQVRELQCFRIFGVVSFNNYGINGQIPVTLKTHIEEITCHGGDTEHAEAREWFMAIVTVGLCSLSVVFSARTFGFSLLLAMKTSKHYKECINKAEIDDINTSLSCGGKMEIIKLRDLVIILSDVCTIIGSIMKIILNNKNLSSSSDNFDICGILIGIGCLLTWLGVLHYLAYDPNFNLLFSVMWSSASKVLRFLLCVGMLYLGFTLCGWVVLGPYHIKFAAVSSSFQCLMSLLNGDEIYVTYTAVDGEKLIAWWFNVIFVTVFVVVFTLITLNIFIAIFNSAYEAIRKVVPFTWSYTTVLLIFETCLFCLLFIIRRYSEKLPDKKRKIRTKCLISWGKSYIQWIERLVLNAVNLHAVVAVRTLIRFMEIEDVISNIYRKAGSGSISERWEFNSVLFIKN